MKCVNDGGGEQVNEVHDLPAPKRCSYAELGGGIALAAGSVYNIPESCLPMLAFYLSQVYIITMHRSLARPILLPTKRPKDCVLYTFGSHQLFIPGIFVPADRDHDVCMCVEAWHALVLLPKEKPEGRLLRSCVHAGHYRT